MKKYYNASFVASVFIYSNVKILCTVKMFGGKKAMCVPPLA